MAGSPTRVAPRSIQHITDADGQLLRGVVGSSAQIQIDEAIADIERRARSQLIAEAGGAIQSDAQYAVDSTNRWRLSRWRRRNSATRSFGHFSRSTLIFEIDSRRSTRIQ